MNRVVRLGDLLVRQGVLGFVLLLPCLLSVSSKIARSSVPDAPTPQGPDSLGNITSGVTPGKGTQDLLRTRAANTTQPPPAGGNQPAGQDQQAQPPEVPRTRRDAKGHHDASSPASITSLVPVTVLDKKHQQVAGLTWRDFEIYENNVRQHIDLFSADAGAALRCPGYRPEPAKRHHEEGER